MTIGEIDLLAAPEPPGADHKETNQPYKRHPDDGNPADRNRNAAKKMNDCSDHACCRRNRHTHKIFSTRTARILWYRIGADIEACQTACAAQQKNKTDKRAQLHQLLPMHWIRHGRQHTKAPGKG